jgi:hypothetical protein
VGLIHQFATNVYYERKFSAVAESIFEMYKRDLDIRLSAVASDVLAKFPAIYARLVDNDPEAISQALNSCRRVIDAFADALVPSSDLKVQLDQEEIAISNEGQRINFSGSLLNEQRAPPASNDSNKH